MKLFLTAGAAALALTLAGCGGDDGNAQSNAASSTAPLKQIPAPNGDWSQTIVKTAEGGFRMGNPNAPVKLIEYGSISCPHCAEFEEQGAGPLRDTYVKSGQVSWEFRTYLLFGADPGVSLLLHCQTEGAFFPLVEQLYASQGDWLAKIQALPPEQLQQIQSLPPRESAVTLIRAGGVDEFFRQRGMPKSKIDACLADSSGLEKLAQIKKRGDEEGVNGTPSFFLDGKFTNAGTWRDLEPMIRAALP
jgi:protein-disulfide isomerase